MKAVLALLLLVGMAGSTSYSKPPLPRPMAKQQGKLVVYRITGTNNPTREQTLRCYYLPSSKTTIDVEWDYDQGDNGFTFGTPSVDATGNYIDVTAPDYASIVSFSGYLPAGPPESLVDKILQVY